MLHYSKIFNKKALRLKEQYNALVVKTQHAASYMQRKISKLCLKISFDEVKKAGQKFWNDTSPVTKAFSTATAVVSLLNLVSYARGEPVLAEDIFAIIPPLVAARLSYLDDTKKLKNKPASEPFRPKIEGSVKPDNGLEERRM